MSPSTGQSQALEPVEATNASGCPDDRGGTESGNTSPYKFDIPAQLTARHHSQFRGGGYGGEIRLVQVSP